MCHTGNRSMGPETQVILSFSYLHKLANVSYIYMEVHVIYPDMSDILFHVSGGMD